MMETKDILIFLNHYFVMVEISTLRPSINSPSLSSYYTYDLIGSDFYLNIIENYLGWVVEFSLTKKSSNSSNIFIKPYYKSYIWDGGLHQDTLSHSELLPTYETILPIEKEDIFPNLVNFLHTQHPDIIRDVKLDDILDQ